MNNYTVYIHISPSGKRYIGITKQKPEYRWNNGKGYKQNKHFYNAIEKYGWDNFQHIIVAKRLTEDEAKWLEIELIKEWNSTNKKYGYNNSLGGESYNCSEETKMKISESSKGKFLSEEHKEKISNALKGRNLTEEHRKNLSIRNKNENNPMYGKHHSEETKKKISEKGKKPIICLTTNKIFSSCIDASIEYNVNRKNLPSHLKGKRKSCGKLSDGTPLIWMYLEEFLDKCKYTIL